MKLIMAQYIEINLIGIIILLTVAFYVVCIQHDISNNDQCYFVKMLFCNMVILISDIFIYLLRWHASVGLVITNHLFCILFFILHTYFGYLWLNYSIIKLFPDFQPNKKIKIFMLLPIILNSLFVISSPWTKFVYSLTVQNRYIRGSFMWITMVFSMSYWISSTLLTFYEMLKTQRVRERSTYIALLFFPIPTLIGNIIQLKFYGLSIVWICSAISLLILFINLQNHQISRDVLTNLFSRGQTNKQIQWEIKHLNDANYYLFCVMIDVDHFKKINDEFGHVIGDQALIETANILRKSCQERYFIGRFGGDEFLIIGHIKEKEEIHLLLDNIRLLMKVANEKSTLFSLSLSMGYQLYSNEDHPTVDAILSDSDKEMYKTKQSNH